LAISGAPTALAVTTAPIAIGVPLFGTGATVTITETSAANPDLIASAVASATTPASIPTLFPSLPGASTAGAAAGVTITFTLKSEPVPVRFNFSYSGSTASASVTSATSVTASTSSVAYAWSSNIPGSATYSSPVVSSATTLTSTPLALVIPGGYNYSVVNPAIGSNNCPIATPSQVYLNIADSFTGLSVAVADTLSLVFSSGVVTISWQSL
jgi:hypothetical protein